MTKAKNIKSELIRSGMSEISEYGIREFSLRRVAARCGVSCAAPYKHFRDKEEFLCAIFQQINDEWKATQQQILSYPLDLREMILELSVAYIMYLAQNPGYANLVVMNDNSLGQGLKSMKTELTAGIRRLVYSYCEENGLSEEVRRRKVFFLRGAIYGAVVVMTADEDMVYTDQHLKLVRDVINRAFVLD